jgi:hypothetical protein
VHLWLVYVVNRRQPAGDHPADGAEPGEGDGEGGEDVGEGVDAHVHEGEGDGEGEEDRGEGGEADFFGGEPAEAGGEEEEGAGGDGDAHGVAGGEAVTGVGGEDVEGEAIGARDLEEVLQRFIEDHRAEEGDGPDERGAFLMLPPQEDADCKDEGEEEGEFTEGGEGGEEEDAAGGGVGVEGEADGVVPAEELAVEELVGGDGEEGAGAGKEGEEGGPLLVRGRWRRGLWGEGGGGHRSIRGLTGSSARRRRLAGMGEAPFQRRAL